MLEPWLSTVLARRNSHEALPAAPTELLVITALFALVIVAMLLASARLSAAFRLASWRGALSSRAKDPAVAATGSAMVRDRELTEMRSRATATANAIASLHQREAIGRELASRNRARFELRPAGTSEQRPAVGLHTLPTGRAFPRRGRGRASASARRRDGNP